MKAALSVLRFLRERRALGERCALVTLTGVTGGAARAPGEHMAVAEDGSAIGSFSGGCIEAAVIAEAQDVMETGTARLVRFGAGSRYIDIRLPCGGSIDLLFSPQPALAELERGIRLLEGRLPVIVSVDQKGAVRAEVAHAQALAHWEAGTFLVRHDPALRLAVLGHGAEPGALLSIARAYGADAYLLTPQASLIAEAQRQGVRAGHLRVLGRDERLAVDPWTAVVTLFHDHDWEIALLMQALEAKPFFVGAMGSRKTHAERRRKLLDAGVSQSDVDCIQAPIGLIPASRDPQTLGLSIMAQVVQAYDRLLILPPQSPIDQIKLNSSHHCVERASVADRTERALNWPSGNPVHPEYPKPGGGRKEDQSHVGHV